MINNSEYKTFVGAKIIQNKKKYVFYFVIIKNALH